MASRTGTGRAGEKAIPPCAKTPVETVIMPARPRMRPKAPSATTPPPPHSSRDTPAPRRIGNPSANVVTSVPSPRRSTRFGPSKAVAVKSCRLMRESSAAQICAPSQCATSASKRPPLGAASEAARSGKPSAAAASITRQKRSSASEKALRSACVAKRPSVNSKRWRSLS